MLEWPLFVIYLHHRIGFNTSHAHVFLCMVQYTVMMLLEVMASIFLTPYSFCLLSQRSFSYLEIYLYGLSILYFAVIFFSFHFAASRWYLAVHCRFHCKCWRCWACLQVSMDYFAFLLLWCTSLTVVILWEFWVCDGGRQCLNSITNGRKYGLYFVIFVAVLAPLIFKSMETLIMVPHIMPLVAEGVHKGRWRNRCWGMVIENLLYS